MTLTLTSVFCDGTRLYVILLKELCEIPAIENLCSWKLDQSSLKSLEICYAPMPLIVPNFVALGQTMNEKSVAIFFYIIQYFGAPGVTLGQSSLISALMYSKASSINLPNFVLS